MLKIGDFDYFFLETGYGWVQHHSLYAIRLENNIVLLTKDFNIDELLNKKCDYELSNEHDIIPLDDIKIKESDFAEPPHLIGFDAPDITMYKIDKECDDIKKLWKIQYFGQSEIVACVFRKLNLMKMGKQS